MKLIFCPKCQDVRKLHDVWGTWCYCGASGGRYLNDGLHAHIWGASVPIGINNLSFVKALRNRPKELGKGESFDAFVIPEVCSTIEFKEVP